MSHTDTIHPVESTPLQNSDTVENGIKPMQPVPCIQSLGNANTVVESICTTPTSAKDSAKQSLHTQQQSMLSEQYLGFMIHNSEWLIPLEYVKRIVVVSENAILPQCSESIMGVLDTDEGIVPIVNSVTFYGSENCCAYLNAKNTIILCCLHTDTIGLFVHSTTRIYKTAKDLSVYQNSEMEVHMATTHSTHPCVSVMLLQKGRLLPAIDIEYIFEQAYHSTV